MTDDRKRAVFLDRDGVLNRVFVRDGVPHPPDRVDELTILPGVEHSLARLADAGFALIVVTNQPDVARGRQSREQVEAINKSLQDKLPLLDDICVCFHDNADNCPCRKPKPGMMVAAAARRNLALDQSFMVGDRWSDVVAGAAAGCTTLLIEMPYTKPNQCHPDYTVVDLAAATTVILSLRTSPQEH